MNAKSILLLITLYLAAMGMMSGGVVSSLAPDNFIEVWDVVEGIAGDAIDYARDYVGV